jgi:colanic acid biosynthesis glycosyl transferase WcaI
MSRLILVNRYFHPDQSATSQLLTDLAVHLAGRHQVLVLTSRQLLEQPQARLAGRDVLGGIQIRRLWSTALGRGSLPGRALDYASFLAGAGLWLLFRIGRGDIILAKTDPPLLGVVTTLATLGRSVRRIQWLQDLYPETAIRLGVVRDGLLVRMARALRDWSLRRSHLVVTVSAGMQDRLRPMAGAARVEHLPNWADDCAPEADGKAPRAQLVVGYSGNLGRAHPIEGLLQLAEAPPDSSLRFLISGGGAHYERLRARVQKLKRADWTFLPYQPRDQVAALLRRSDVHLVLLDPRVEKLIFPSKIYGILAAGRPILHLGDPAGEVAALVRAHGCGWSVPADSGPEIQAVLERLAGAPEELAEAGRRARAAYERHFSRAVALARWDALLEVARTAE